jgi:cell division protein ZipA
MDIKDWILIGGGLLLATVIAHGFYLAWTARRAPLKMAIDQDLIPPEEVDPLLLLRAELPNGGARVVRREPEQPSLDLGGEDASADPAATAAPAGSPAAGALVTEKRGHGALRREPTRPSQPRAAPTSPARKRFEPVRRDPARQRTNAPAPLQADALSEPVRAAPRAEDLIVINVLARGDARFEGIDLMAAFLRNSLEFGDMNIFHRKDRVTKAPRFSVASAVEPGSFDLAAMGSFSTPGVTFFLDLAGTPDPLATFDDMLAVARDVASSLAGDLKDEQRCVMTAQTIEHCRQRISEHSRKRMSQRG